MTSGDMNYLFRVMGQLQAALAPLAHEEDVRQTLSQLPQIVVLGGQSAGKSTLLEAIANLPGFLPKGGGMQTKRPLLLRLQNDPSTRCTVATFQNPHPNTDVKPNSPVYSTESISKYIADENKVYDGVSSVPIQLTLSGPDLPTLTLVDLPGFTPNRKMRANMPEEIRQLVMEYVKGKENILMLAVTSAIEDTDNSLAEPFAVEVDPLRLRTIGVYTKMDKAPDTAWAELYQASVSKTPDCIGVKLPDTEKHLRWAQNSMLEARWQEQDWFDLQLRIDHSDCKSMPNVGVHYLLWRVQKWLVPQITKSLNMLKENMEDGLQQASQEVVQMGSLTDTGSPSGVASYIAERCSEVDVIFAEFAKHAGGAQFLKLVKMYKFKEIHRDLDTKLDFEAAAEIIENAKGPNEGIGDWSEDGCRELAQQTIGSFEQPAQAMLQQIEALIRNLAEQAVKTVKELDPYPVLKTAMLQATSDAVIERTKAAAADVATILEKHKAQVDEQTLSELKKKAEKAASVKDEVAATMQDSDDIENALLPQAFKLKRGAMARAQEQAEEEKKIRRNVELTTRIVREYITQHVEPKLSFDIPASWRLFMLVGGGGVGVMQRQGLLTSRPDCFSKKCRALADGKRQQQANHAKLAGYLEEQPETAVKRKKLTDKIAAYEEALQGLAKVAAVPALGDFQRLPKPSDIRRVPSGLAVPGISETPTAPLLPVQPLADPMVAKGFELQDGAMELPEPSDEEGKGFVKPSAVQERYNRADDRDAIAKCESGFGTVLRAAVWGAEWMAYSTKYALVQSYGVMDKTVATGGCTHEVSSNFNKREQTRAGWLEYKQQPPLSMSKAAHSKGRQIHQDTIKHTSMTGQQDEARENLIKARV